MKFDSQATRAMIQSIADTVIGHAAELTDLDRAIGDADHGVNLERGFRAVLDKIDAISALPLDRALSETGRTLIMSVGGASGPLYGKLFATLGQHLQNIDPLTKDSVVAACEQAMRVVKALGRSDVGDKTMLDVLVPTLDWVRAANGASTIHGAAERAHEAAIATIPMIARRGRASFLGERSRGHMDPGARSSELMVAAVCRFIESRL